MIYLFIFNVSIITTTATVIIIDRFYVSKKNGYTCNHLTL